jgi:hypothetical protein
VEWDAWVVGGMGCRICKTSGEALRHSHSPTTWMSRPIQGRSTLGQVLGEMRISTAKKQVFQSIAGAFPGIAVLHKWRLVFSPAYMYPVTRH